MARVEPAKPALNIDFWPAKNLGSWLAEPEHTFLSWMSELRVIGDRQFRESSRETYAAMFSWWLNLLKAKGLNMLEASGTDATKFFEESNFEPVTRRRYLQLLDRVYRHLNEIGWTGKNPLLVELRKERELEIALPPGLDESALAHLIHVLTDIPGWKGSRDRGAAALLIGAGLRVSEFIPLRLGAVSKHYDIALEHHSIHREHVTLILPDGPWRAWYDAWVVRRHELNIPGDVLCPATMKGVAYSPSGLFRRVSAWLTPLGANLPQTGPNLLRNTFARQALTCGRYESHQVQEFMGHQELRATSRHLAAIGAINS